MQHAQTVLAVVLLICIDDEAWRVDEFRTGAVHGSSRTTCKLQPDRPSDPPEDPQSTPACHSHVSVGAL
jgi:hypothetical protein